MPIVEHLPALIIANLLIFAFIMPLLAIWKKEWCVPATLVSMGLALLMSVVMAIQVNNLGPYVYHMGGWAPPWGIEFKVEYLSTYMLLVLHGIGLLIVVYSIRDLKEELAEKVIGWYYTLYLLLMGAMSGMALTNDLFNLFVFMEICAIASCAIISIKEDRECLEATFKYLILSAMGTGCYLLSVAMLYMVTGYMNMDMVSTALEVGAEQYPYNVLVAMSLMVVSFGVKAALFPLHVWLPDAHASAPSPSSAVLSGLVIKIYAVALVHLIFRAFPLELFDMIPMLEVILWLATFGMLFGSIFAMVQDNFKKMLAYSSIAQIGYVFMGLGLFNELALVGGLLHILNHAVMKAMLFMVAGIIIHTSGLKHLRHFEGIGVRLRWTMAAFTVGGASMVGIPITAGFISKLYLAWGALDVDRPFFLIVILISSLLNAVYYFPISINAFLAEHQREDTTFKPIYASMMAPVLILLFLIFFLGLSPQPVVGMLEQAVETFFN